MTLQSHVCFYVIVFQRRLQLGLKMRRVHVDATVSTTGDITVGTSGRLWTMQRLALVASWCLLLTCLVLHALCFLLCGAFFHVWVHFPWKHIKQEFSNFLLSLVISSDIEVILLEIPVLSGLNIVVMSAKISLIDCRGPMG